MNKDTTQARYFLAFYTVTVFFKEDLSPPALAPTYRDIHPYIIAESSSEALLLACKAIPEGFRIIGSIVSPTQILVNVTA
jgi:hypothetical protein